MAHALRKGTLGLVNVGVALLSASQTEATRDLDIIRTGSGAARA